MRFRYCGCRNEEFGTEYIFWRHSCTSESLATAAWVWVWVLVPMPGKLAMTALGIVSVLTADVVADFDGALAADARREDSPVKA